MIQQQTSFTAASAPRYVGFPAAHLVGRAGARPESALRRPVARRAALGLLLAAPAGLLATADAEASRRSRRGRAARRRLIEPPASRPVLAPGPVPEPCAAPPAHQPRPRPASATAPADQRRVAFLRRETGERVDTVYFERGAYDADAIRDIQWALRDVATDKLGVIHPRLIDLLSAVARECRGHELIVTSAFRSRETNDRLPGAAPNSLHLRGMAVDFYAQGLSTLRFARIVGRLGMGGVGAYPRRGFVHADVGAKRVWRG